MDITGISKEKILCILYYNAKFVNKVIGRNKKRRLSYNVAKCLLQSDKRFDILDDKLLFIDLSGNNLNTKLYNRQNGKGKAEELIATIK